jgi:hypothetical protein
VTRASPDRLGFIEQASRSRDDSGVFVANYAKR